MNKYKTEDVIEFCNQQIAFKQKRYDENKALYDAACAEIDARSKLKKFFFGSEHPCMFYWDFYFIGNHLKDYRRLLNEALYMKSIEVEFMQITDKDLQSVFISWVS